MEGQDKIGLETLNQAKKKPTTKGKSKPTKPSESRWPPKNNILLEKAIYYW